MCDSSLFFYSIRIEKKYKNGYFYFSKIFLQIKQRTKKKGKKKKVSTYKSSPSS